MAAHHCLTVKTLFLLVVVALTIDSTTSASLNKPNATEPTKTGDFSTISVNASQVQHFADFAASQISSSNSTVSMKPGDNVTSVKIVKAAATKVPSENGSGMNFEMTLELDGEEDDDDLYCEVLVFSRSYELLVDELILTDYTCVSITNGSAEAEAIPEPAPVPIFIPFFPVAVNDTKVEDIAKFANGAVASTRNSTNNLTEIEKAESQVYATGINYKLILKLKGVDGDDMLCEVVVSDPTQKDVIMDRELTQYNCAWNSTSSAEQEEDIPDDSILSKWFFE
uniref:Cystatin domain-containing protein n=1 Tax=Daphnia galeata TaxID=27404 RepID=A0A8J2WM30_9CRUS|nr:unnamed protein product [Daphnia galeata]